MNSLYSVIRGLITEHGTEFLINCGESHMTVGKDEISFHSHITGDDTTIREDTPITFDAERNEFVWYDWDGEQDVEYRAKPYLELTHNLAEAFAMLYQALAEVELNKLEDNNDDCLAPDDELHDSWHQSCWLNP